jgi:hypothetical protein
MQFRQKCAAPESLNPPENAFQNPALSVAEGLYGQEYCPFTVRSGVAASTPGETAIPFASLDLMICHGCRVRSVIRRHRWPQTTLAKRAVKRRFGIYR